MFAPNGTGYAYNTDGCFFSFNLTSKAVDEVYFFAAPGSMLYSLDMWSEQLYYIEDDIHYTGDSIKSTLKKLHRIAATEMAASTVGIIAENGCSVYSTFTPYGNHSIYSCDTLESIRFQLSQR